MMTQVQRRRVVAGALVLMVVVAVVVGLVSRGNGPSADHASLVTWYDATGRQASQSTSQLFDRLLVGLSHSKVNDGGPGIVSDKPTCQQGAASVATYSKDPPPAGALRTSYDEMMHTGASVFADCLAGIAATVLSTSKQDVTSMQAEISAYSTMITSYDKAVTAARL